MAPTLTVNDVIPDAIAGYLATLTAGDGIDWLDWTATLQPPAGGASAYSGLVELLTLTETPAVTRSPQLQILVSVRLFIAKDDVSALSAEASAWARTLSEWLDATKTLATMAKLGANLGGTYQGVTVPANLCLKATWEPLEVQIDVNQGDGYQSNAGGVASVRTRGRVIVATR